MKINVGSTNQVKVEAVSEVVKEYEFLSEAKVLGIEVNSKISDQPKSLDETILGAMNRAKEAYTNCEYSIGIESGIKKIPFTKTGYMEFSVCAIYDGKEHHLGLSPAFECPKEIVDVMFKENLNLSQACYKLGYTKNKNLGKSEGIIGILTKWRVTRKDYTKQAIFMAMIHIDK
jgi:inosine/xanthosine triphosphatase